MLSSIYNVLYRHYLPYFNSLQHRLLESKFNSSFLQTFFDDDMDLLVFAMSSVLICLWLIITISVRLWVAYLPGILLPLLYVVTITVSFPLSSVSGYLYSAQAAFLSSFLAVSGVLDDSGRARRRLFSFFFLTDFFLAASGDPSEALSSPPRSQRAACPLRIVRIPAPCLLGQLRCACVKGRSVHLRFKRKVMKTRARRTAAARPASCCVYRTEHLNLVFQESSMAFEELTTFFLRGCFFGVEVDATGSNSFWCFVFFILYALQAHNCELYV